jgi:glycosyltransferase involved in cell wall biosynthesis
VVVNGELEETFDLGFALSPVSDSRQINVLNRHCVRWVVSHFDVIALRINGLLEVNYTRRQVVLDSLVWADRVIPISNAALDDIESFFGQDAASGRGHSTVIHEGVATIGLPAVGTDPTNWDENVAELIAAGGYALVVGNIFGHKQLPEALERLAGAPFPVVAFGSLGSRQAPEGVHLVIGGMLSDAQVDELYRHAGCVVIPSAYEGFGLPIAEASQRGRPLVLFDMAVSREVVASLGVADLVHYFCDFDKLVDTVAAALDTPEAIFTIQNRPMRTLDEYNSGILDVLLEVLATPVDLIRLRERISGFRRVEVYADNLERRVAELSANVNSGSYRAFAKLSKPLRPFRPLFRLAWRGVRRIRG